MSATETIYSLRPVAETDELDSAFADMPLRMSSRQLAEYLPETPVKTLEYWRGKGVGPNYVKAADTGKVWYLKPDVVAWILQGRRITTQP